ncbi:MAG: sugar phosphate isomerase/epimerase [Verrucomicrobia bacterium]|nr:sugar phosphate isomerase/epimerase [Verrucomicrobiota bacterium]
MRVGVLTKGEVSELDWAYQLGFRSIEWVGFAESRCGPKHLEWRQHADEIAAAAKERDIRISAIGALYGNPLDPRQTDFARSVFQRAIEVAGYLGIRTVAGFSGAVIETELNERGGNLIYKPFEQYLPRLLEFWEPLARFAAEHRVRIAFEHCPQGAYHLPVMSYNMMGQTAIWERLFNQTKCDNVGIEWDASHLICQFVDPVQNIHRFGSRIFHVHAKDAYINRQLLERYGICHPGVAEHRMPGFGQANWAEIVHALLRAGYDSDLNIEGWHDPVYRDHPQTTAVAGPLAGRKLETVGLLVAKRLLEQYSNGTE